MTQQLTTEHYKRISHYLKAKGWKWSWLHRRYTLRFEDLGYDFNQGDDVPRLTRQEALQFQIRADAENGVCIQIGEIDRIR